MNAFLPADILMPKTDHMEKWAVIACDQFTSDQAYWDRVRKNAEGAVSTINLILPEAELGTEKEAEHTAEINAGPPPPPARGWPRRGRGPTPPRSTPP